MQKLTKFNLRVAYKQTVNFFEANPDKWIRRRMHQAGCFCFAGRMAYELGANPDRCNSSFFEEDGWAVDNAIRDKVNPYRPMWYVNDTSDNVTDMLARMDNEIGQKLMEG